MTDPGLAAVLAAGLLEAGYMAWTRLPTIPGLPSGDAEDGPVLATLRRYASRPLRTNGGLTALVALAAVVAGTPAGALGVDVADPGSVGMPALAAGLGLGVALYLLTELLVPAVEAAGFAYEPGYDRLAPASRSGWLSLLGVTLPLVSVREEGVFRVALVGAAAAVLGVSPWPLAVASTVVFGAIHFTGDGGVVIAAVLGGCLAAAFVLTNSLLAVVVAHTLVNGLEFLVHVGAGADPGRRLARAVGGSA